MANAVSSRFQFGYILESTWGTTPSAPRQNFRSTGGTLKAVNNTVVSDEIRSDGQITDLVRVGVQATASVPFEMSFGALDDFLTLALRNEWESDTGFDGAEVGTDLLSNGITLGSATIEGEYSDIGQFLTITGARVDSLSLRMAVGAIVTGTMEFTGAVATVGGSSAGTGDASAAPTNDVFDPVRMSGIQEGGSNVELRAIELDINNGARPQQVLGTDSLAGVGLGRFNVTGAIEAYTPDASLMTKYIGHADSSLSWSLGDAAGNKLAFLVDRLKYSDGEWPVNGNDEDIVQRYPYQAIMAPSSGSTLRITRTPA